jgi:peptidoglycan hydrolase CwlO-like protein
MMIIFKKTILAALAAALVFAAFPLTSAFAQDKTPSNEKLEQAWARQLKNYERLGKGFEDSDAQIAKFQARIDKAAEKGKDVAALQAALDAFESALKSGEPIYEGMSIIVNSHKGFDANGKVTDIEQAKSTLKEMRAKMQELKSAMNGTGEALRKALKAFREANKPTVTPQKDT